MRSCARTSSLPTIVALVGGVLASGCREPTQAVLRITTDAACDTVGGTGIAYGLLGDIETDPYLTTTSDCSGGGNIGSIVLLPAEEDDEAFAFKVVTSLGEPAESCVAPDYGPSCIVARRAMRFIPHEPFDVPVRMSQACAGVFCPPDQTCVDGVCQSASCAEAGGCDPAGTMPPPFVAQLGGPGSEMARDLAFRDGILVLAGNFDESLDAGGGKLVSKDAQDAFVAAFSPAGQHRWSTSFGGPGLDEAISVAIDPAGDVYVLATFSESVDPGGGLLESAGGTDLVLVKLRSFGKLVWAQRLGGADGDLPGEVATAPDGSVYVVGSFTGSVSFGDHSIEAAGKSDAFVASFTPAGAVRWAEALGGPSDDAAVGVGVDAAGNVYVGGSFEAEAVLGGGPALVAVGTADGYLASFDADGNHRWSKSFGAKGRDLVIDVSVRDDRVVATGVLANEALFDDVVLPASNFDGFVLALDGSGTLAWSHVFGDSGNDQGERVSIGADGTIVVSGETFGGEAFGTDAAELPGVRHPLLVVLGDDGEVQWARSYASSTYAGAPAVAAASGGFAYLAGWFVDALALTQPPLASKGTEDAFLLLEAPPSPSP